jgi:hypothetical protein
MKKEPFDDEQDEAAQSAQSKKVGLKKVSTQQSIFDSMPKKPSQEDLDSRVRRAINQSTDYKQRAAELALQFKKSVEDRTIPENKTPFQREIEKELLIKMMQLAIEINNDDNEDEGMGSLGWIALLMRTAFMQRDKINRMEYTIAQLEQKISASIDIKK